MGDTDFALKGDGDSMFESGDQDYASAIGWQPGADANMASPTPITDQLIEEDRKKNPRAYAREPEMLSSRPMADWLENAFRGRPVTGLFGPFWQEGELSILFAGTGVGKSALAVQIGEGLARGVAFPPFGPAAPDNPGRMRLLYIDFELSEFQLAMRYSRITDDGKNHEHPYPFSPNMVRARFGWNGKVIEGYDGFSDMFFTNLRSEINATEARALIVDNITFLDRRSTANANIAMSIMRGLEMIKNQCVISILVLAHTPKRRPWEPMTELDLQGSINLGNFADSMFAIGRSRRGDDLRYIKQVKVRTGRPEYGASCVPMFRLGKFDYLAATGNGGGRPVADNFLGFRFVEFGREDDHLALRPRAAKHTDGRLDTTESIIKNAKHLAAEGNSAGKIAKELGIPRTTAFRYMQAV